MVGQKHPLHGHGRCQRGTVLLDVREGGVFLSHSLAVSKCTMPYDSSTPTAIIHAVAVVHVPLMDIISSN